MTASTSSHSGAQPTVEKKHVDKPWLLDPPKPFKFVNASIVDPKDGVVVRDAYVTVAGGRIVQVGFMKDGEASDENTTKIDLEGKYLCPGLVDCHVHMTAVPGEIGLKNTFKNLPEPTINYRTAFLCKTMLSRGFTTARDCGGAPGSLKEAISEWLIPGPRLLTSGHALSQTGGHGDQRDAHNDDPTAKCCGGHKPGIGRLCDGVRECIVAVRDEIRKGADFIKIMGGGGIASPLNNLEHVQFLPEELQAITRTAATFNTYVTAHAYTDQAIRNAVDNGVMGIEHGNFMSPGTAKYLAEKGVYLTPTLVTFKALATPPFDVFMNEACRAKNKTVMDSALKGLKIAEDAGITMCYGSDLLAGMHKWQTNEFTLRSQVLSPLSILRSATINGAKMMGLEKDIGRLQEGGYADLLILNKNPLDDITILDSPESLLAVMKEGHIFRSKLESLPAEIERCDEW